MNNQLSKSIKKIKAINFTNFKKYCINYTIKSQKERTMKKTMTFAMLHFTVAFTVAYLLTGSFLIGGLMALVEPAINTVAFYFHELVWKKVEAKKMAENYTHNTSATITNIQI